MMVFKRISGIGCLLLVVWALSSCEQKIMVESVVHEDGSVDRTIVFNDADSSRVANNIFGLKAENGWDLNVTPVPDAEKKDEKEKYSIAYHKRFESVEDMNDEMNAGDTLFKVRSELDKRFRWFYTYMDYSDTYVAINRFVKVDPNDFFTPEDYEFIKRLPAEGKDISKADELQVTMLNEKIYEHFAVRAMFEEQFEAAVTSIKEMDQVRWVDSLNKKKEKMFGILNQKKDDSPDDWMLPLLDSVDIPHNIIDQSIYKAENVRIRSKIDFMSSATEGKFTHIISLPWSVVESNADSLAGDRLVWQPPVIKFMLQDYKMYATSRKPNYWAMILSATVVFVTLLAFIRVRAKNRPTGP